MKKTFNQETIEKVDNILRVQYLGVNDFDVVKKTNENTNWEIFDTGRNPHNVADLKLGANLNVADNGSDLGTTSQNNIDIYSTGFKARTGNTDTNGDFNKFFYMAFAESPFVSSEGTPTTAR